MIENKIVVTQDLINSDENNRVELFHKIAAIEGSYDNDTNLESTLSEINIDFDDEVKIKLINTILQIENSIITPIKEDYLVKISLKDDSTFVYAPRRFAWLERLLIREITDDLLNRQIIKYSNSPYCARVVPVKKKNGSLRLCVVCAL